MRLLTSDEKKTVYPKLFEQVFGFKNSDERVRDVFVHEDKQGNLRGFVSGYMVTKSTFYMSWGGVVKGLSFKGTRRYWQQCQQELKQRGVAFFETKVENTNTAWQRMLMGMEWIPHGIHVADGKVYIQYYKRL